MTVSRRLVPTSATRSTRAACRAWRRFRRSGCGPTPTLTVSGCSPALPGPP